MATVLDILINPSIFVFIGYTLFLFPTLFFNITFRDAPIQKRTQRIKTLRQTVAIRSEGAFESSWDSHDVRNDEWTEYESDSGLGRGVGRGRARGRE